MMPFRRHSVATLSPRRKELKSPIEVFKGVPESRAAIFELIETRDFPAEKEYIL